MGGGGSLAFNSSFMSNSMKVDGGGSPTSDDEYYYGNTSGTSGQEGSPSGMSSNASQGGWTSDSDNENVASQVRVERLLRRSGRRHQ